MRRGVSGAIRNGGDAVIVTFAGARRLKRLQQSPLRTIVANAEPWSYVTAADGEMKHCSLVAHVTLYHNILQERDTADSTFKSRITPECEDQPGCLLNVDALFYSAAPSPPRPPSL